MFKSIQFLSKAATNGTFKALTNSLTNQSVPNVINVV